jgi:small subunit ribosomal protein S20
MKRVKTTARDNLHNRMIRSSMKTAIKKFEATAESEASAGQELLKDAQSLIDKAVSKGVLHKNAANRKKAQLARKASS